MLNMIMVFKLNEADIEYMREYFLKYGYNAEIHTNYAIVFDGGEQIKDALGRLEIDYSIVNLSEEDYEEIFAYANDGNLC